MTVNEALIVLGLKKGCTSKEIKSAFRVLAKKYHPDLAGEQYTKKFTQINEAYEVLMKKGSTTSCKLTHNNSIFKVTRSR